MIPSTNNVHTAAFNIPIHIDLSIPVTLPEGVLWGLGVVYLVLVLASAIVFTMGRLRPEADFEELRLRIRSWWVMVLIFTAALAISRLVSLAFMAALSFLALKEYLSITPLRRADRIVVPLLYLCIPLQFYWIHLGWYGMFIVFVPVYAFLLIPLVMVLIGRTDGFLRAAANFHWGVMTTVFCLSHMAFLLVLPPSDGIVAGGAGLVFFLVLLTEANDVLQFLSGKALGKRKIVPLVSPKKTWAGMIGGMIGTTTLSYFIAPYLTPFSEWQSAAVGALIAFAGFSGDVVVSAVKRDLRLKDSGDLIPGHGGVLDRVDSLIYTAPVFFHFVYYFHY